MKIVFSCLVLTLALGSSALADIIQAQNTALGLGNEILLLQGAQAADAVQNLAVYNQQGATSGASQSFTGNLTEVGQASSGGADIGLQQNVVAGGLQTQDISGFWGLPIPSVTNALPSLNAGATILSLQGLNTSGTSLPTSLTLGSMPTQALSLLMLP